MKGRHLLICVLIFTLLTAFAFAEESPVLPRVQFYITGYIGHLGRETSVIVQCSNPKAVDKDNNTFELRSHRGQVLAVKQWTNPASRLTFRFTVTEDMLGGHDLSVWWNGQCVTADTAYAAFSDLNVKRVTQLEPDIPAISVTIVCGGGSTRDVEDILAVLDKHRVKCTFFLSGGWLEKNVENAQRIADAGHEIASHGYQHVHMPQMNNYRSMRSVITKMNDRCEELLGVRPRFFRAPYSDTNQKVTALVRAEGMEEIQWSIDSLDWADKYKNQLQAIVKRVTGKTAVSGSVIQFHLNGYNTPEVLDEIIPRYQTEFGYRVVTVGELMALSGREVPELPDAQYADD